MITIYAISFGLSFILAWFSIGTLIKFACRRNMYDLPNERKVHTTNVPRLGGAPFFPIVLLVMLVVVVAMKKLLPTTEIGLSTINAIILVLSALPLYVAGMTDDIRGLGNYRVKFFVLTIVGIIMCLSGFYIQNVHGFFGFDEVSPFAGWALTIFGMILATVAINFIDGIDGLASCITLIGLIFYLIIFSMHGAIFMGAIAASLIGVLLAYIRYNLFGSIEKHTKTFMGDAGSQILGWLLLFMGIAATNNGGDLCSSTSDIPFALAFAPLMLPCIEVPLVVARRKIGGHSLVASDKSHIHHKLLSLEFSQHQALVWLLVIDILMIAATWALSLIWSPAVVIGVIMAAWIGVNLILTNKISKKNK